MSPPPAFVSILDDLALLGDWEDRYRYLIELGETLPPLPNAEKTAANRVQGCVSQVWLVSERRNDTIHLSGDSDALIVRGLVAMVLALYSGRPASEVAATDALTIFDEIGLREHLSGQRANGLAAMVQRIRRDAS